MFVKGQGTARHILGDHQLHNFEAVDVDQKYTTADCEIFLKGGKGLHIGWLEIRV